MPAQAVVAVAQRMYGSAENVPDAVGWLRDEEFAFGEPYGSTGEFLWLHERTGSRISDAGFDSIPAAPDRDRTFIPAPLGMRRHPPASL